MRTLLLLLLSTPLFGADVFTPLAIEMRQRNETASNYAPNIYLDVPPNNAPGLLLYGGSMGVAECVTLGAGLTWTPRVAGVSPGRLDVNTTAQVPSDWNASTGVSRILNKPTLFTGAYSDLTGKPSLFSGSYSDLTNKPFIFSGVYSDLAGKPSLFSGSYLDLSNRPSTFSTTWTDVSGKPSFFDGVYSSLTGKPVLFSGSWTDLTNKPALFDGAYNSLTGKPSLFDGTWISLSGKPAFSTVATTGAYADLSGKPTIPAAQVQSDWNAVSGLGVILNKPTLGTAASQNSTVFDSAGAASAAQSFSIQRGNHTGVQAQNTVTNLVTDLAGKAPVVHTHVIADTTGLQTALDGKASTTHTHAISDVTGLQTALNSKPVIYRSVGVVAGGQGRVTFSYPSFGTGVVPIVQAIAVKPTGSLVSYNTSIYADPTDTTCVIETNTVNLSITGILGAITVGQAAPNGTKIHFTATAP